MNYEKFHTAAPEVKTTKSTQTPLIVICALLVICLILLAGSAIAIGIGVGVSVPKQETESVQVYTLTEEELRGQYYGINGGIYFQSKINSSHVYFSVTTDDGRMIVLFVRPLNTPMVMMDVNQTGFLLMENQQGSEMYSEYLIPENYMNTMMSIMTGGANMSSAVLEQLDTEAVNKTRQSSLRNLAMSPEANLIIETAQALGNLGIQGTDSLAVLKFYQFAMILANARDLQNSATPDLIKRDSGNVIRRKRAARECDRPGGNYCDQNQCPVGSGCFGMCGYACSCWSFVCGDCCVHEYCRSHDQCCADRGFFSYQCLSVAWRVLGSRCGQTYNC